VKKVKYLLLLFFLFSFLFSDNENEGFAYLQKLRKKANMISFSRNNLLDKASSNHSNYLKINDTGGHIESSSKPSFTGKGPVDRAKQVGLFSKFIGENVSTGQFNFKDSIDDLFTAIYHRLGFLDVSFDMVGLGKSGDKYSYLMSNSEIEDICKNAPSENKGQLICANKKAFGNARISGLKKKIADKNPKFILWPPKNSDDNPPYFYDEHPDPLPNHEVSGNPVSITFNKYYDSSPPSLNTFKLLDSKNKEVKTIFRSKNNAVNSGYIDEYSFILFPDKRLNWNSTYKIEYDFSSKKGNIKGFSTFKTRELKGKVYYTKKKDVELRVIANKEYTVDLIPLNADDKSLAKGYRSNGSAQAEGFTFISLNTFKVTLKGNKGNYVKYTFSGGARTAKLIISDSDDIDNGSQKKEISYMKGWNLNSLLDKTTISNTKDYFKDFNVLYTYDGSRFVFNPNKITYKEAYFIYYTKATKNKVPFKENETYSIDIKTLKKGSWNLVPVGKKISNPSKYFGSKILYVLKNSMYEKPSNNLARGQAIWVKK
jgi:hypothetical protein